MHAKGKNQRVRHVVIILMVAAIFAVGLKVSRPNYREFHIDDRLHFAGHLGVFGNSYFAVVTDRSERLAIPLDADLVLHWSGRSYTVGEITPDDALAMGCELVVPHHVTPPHNVQSGFIGFGPQNRHGGIGFEFDDGRITSFSSRWIRNTGCPFKMSSVNSAPFELPATESVLIEAFGEPTRRKDSFRK